MPVKNRKLINLENKINIMLNKEKSNRLILFNDLNTFFVRKGKKHLFSYLFLNEHSLCVKPYLLQICQCLPQNRFLCI